MQARRDGLPPEQIAERLAPLKAEFLQRMKDVLDEGQNTALAGIADRFFQAPPAGGRGQQPAQPPKQDAPPPTPPAK